jgi:hypothetical protein
MCRHCRAPRNIGPAESRKGLGEVHSLPTRRSMGIEVDMPKARAASDVAIHGLD